MKLLFADLVSSKRDSKYVQDPALLERTRRQAELFGTSVERWIKMGMKLIPLEAAMKPKTWRIYADIRQHGKVRTVMLGDFDSDSSENGLEGFYAACAFAP